MRSTAWTVGAIARRTGVSVRTLHHYDEIGLLSPSRRSAAGYRLYAGEDIARLQRIKSLRRLGFALGEIRDLLDRPDMSPRRVIELHIARLQERIALEQVLCERLQALAQRLTAEEEIPTEDFMHLVEVMTMVENVEKYYTPEQRAELADRAGRLGPERLRQVEREWPELIAAVRAEMNQNSDPGSPEVQELARRWKRLVEEFTGGNPGIAHALRTMYENEPGLRQQTGVDAELSAYIGRAMAALPED